MKFSPRFAPAKWIVAQVAAAIAGLSNLAGVMAQWVMANGSHTPRILDQLIANAQSAASRLRVRSALNPMLWLCGIVSLPSFGLAYLVRGTEPLSSALVYIGGAPIGATIIGFFYLMIFCPEKLQSEDYQLRHETLELIKQKGSSVEISPSSLDAIANPAYRGLRGDGGR